MNKQEELDEFLRSIGKSNEEWEQMKSQFSKERDEKWSLLLENDPNTIRSKEYQLGMTQNEVVDDFIETSCWKQDLPNLVGGKGTPKQRLEALRNAYYKQISGDADDAYGLDEWEDLLSAEEMKSLHNLLCNMAGHDLSEWKEGECVILRKGEGNEWEMED